MPTTIAVYTRRRYAAGIRVYRIGIISFAMVYLLESQYRAQGVRLGLLEEDEIVEFSKQAWFTWLGRKCHEENAPKACQYGGLMANSSEDQEIESIYYFYKAWPETGKSMLPVAVCPYNANPGEGPFDFFNCTGLEDALKENQNPISWKVKNISAAYGIHDIKKLLIKTNRALGIGSPLPDMVYWVPCINSSYENTTECLSNHWPCPEVVQDNASCYRIQLDGRERDGVFLGADDPIFMGELGGHAMNVVGYNDDWLYRNRFQNKETSALLRGGFILHNSWRGVGHSVDYFLGLRSEEVEAVTCPNHNSPINWLPAEENCTRNAVLNGMKQRDALKCTALRRVRGKGIASTSDLLRCINKDLCNPNLTYVLKTSGSNGSDAEVILRPGGVNEISMLAIDFENKNVEKVVIRERPFWSLSMVFQPLGMYTNDTEAPFVPNEYDSCGYWMLPYETMENMNRINWDLLDNFRVFDFEVEFENHSYVRHPDSARYNTTLLRLSTRKKNVTKFDGPIPFDYIYD
jgi:hypothetical protein